jgi:hypothetical protein
MGSINRITVLGWPGQKARAYLKNNQSKKGRRLSSRT